VIILDLSGPRVRVFGKEGEGTSGFDRPQGIALDVRGSIYVADAGNNMVKRFDPGDRSPACWSQQRSRRHAKAARCHGAGRGPERPYMGPRWSGGGAVLAFSAEQEDLPSIVPASALPAVAFLRDLPGEVSALAMNKALWGISGDTLRASGMATAERP